ncbi:MAG: hypothetical protein RR063_10475 [Anaerovoracaceae bacterium]
MKQTKTILLIFTCVMSLVLNGCATSSPNSNSLKFENAPPFIANSNTKSGTSTPQSFVDEFETNEQREADYSIATEQMVRPVEIVDNLKITDFKSPEAATSSNASAEILSAELVEITSDYLPLLENADSTTDLKLALIKLKITNTGDKTADFVCDTQVDRVNKENPIVSLSDENLFLGLAYYTAEPQKKLYGSTIRLTSNETIEVTIGYLIPKSLITDDVEFYYELNSHGDSFFYDTGRKEVYFVEIEK